MEINDLYKQQINHKKQELEMKKFLKKKTTKELPALTGSGASSKNYLFNQFCDWYFLNH